jgi:predicted subunit of tRNA(5-methylaminomethyl-2-thiouridylate) methyltransferase
MQLVNGEHYVLNNDTRAIFPISHQDEVLEEIRYMLSKQKVSIVRINAQHEQGYEVLSSDKYDKIFDGIKERAKKAIESNRAQQSIKSFIVMPASDSKPAAPAQKAAA